MPVFSSDQLRCSLVLSDEKYGEPEYVLNRADGTIVNEIDIGSEINERYRWPKEKKFFSWKMLDLTPDMRGMQQIRMAQEAYNSIEKICGLTLDYKPNLPKTDSTVEWREDIVRFNDKLSVLAHAWLYTKNSSRNGVVEFNDSPEAKHYFTPLGWPVEAYLADPIHFKKGDKNLDGTLKMRRTQPALEILIHELGHTFIGQHDTVNRESMLYPYVKPGYVNGQIQHEAFYWDEISSIPRFQDWYGLPKRGFVPRWLNRWRHRRTLRSLWNRYAK